MPRYEVEIGGSKYEIEAPDEQALSIAIQQVQGGGAPSPAPEASSGVLGGVNNTVRALGRGALGIGAWADELNAATNATLSPLVDPLLPESFNDSKLTGNTWGERYDQSLAMQRQMDKQFDEAHPYGSIGLQVAGGIGSGGALLKAAPAIGSYVMGNTGATLPARVAATMGAGGATGAVQGFGAGEGGAANRAKQGTTEMFIGAGTAGAMMPVAAGATKVTSALVRRIMGQSDDALSVMSPEARRYLGNELADPDKLAMTQSALRDLGPEAMLADVSPDWLGVARGAAARPGTRGMVVDPLNERAAAANTRIRGDVERSLGPDPIPSQIDAEIGGNLNRVARDYGPVMRDRIPYDFTPITNDLDNSIASLRGDAQRRLQQVRGMLNEFGEDAVSTDPAVAFQTRQAIDGMLVDETNPRVISALSEARQMIDDALRESMPRIKEVDANYAELARQREALTQGRPILNNEASAMRPVELEQALQEGALPQGMQIGPSAVPTRMQQGALGEIYRAVGTKANDTTALRNVVRGEGDWNRAKLAMLFGEDNADDALRAIDRETVFGDTANRVTRGSDTAMANRFTKFLDDVEKAQDIPSDTTLTGAAARMGRSLARYLIQGDPMTNANQVASDIGRLSVARGDVRDQIVEAMLKTGKQNVVDKRRADAVRSLFQSGGLAGYQSLPGVR